MSKRSNRLSSAENDGFAADTPIAPLARFDAWGIGVDTPPANAVPETGAAPRQIVFIEGNVPDAEELARGVQPGVRVVLLDPSLDGVRQIADYLTSHAIRNLAAIDIVAHGADGLLDMGGAELSAATIGEYQTELATIGSALGQGGAIQLYGCDVAQDAAGDAFLQQLSHATGGANVAASSGLVGAADEGGDWTLNVAVGTDTAVDPFTAATRAAYPDVLAAPTDKIIFLSSNDQAGPNAVGTRVEQISAQGGAFVAGSTVDIADGSQDSGLATTPSGFAIDTAANEYFVVVDNPTTHALTIQRGTPLSAGSTLTTFYTIPFQDDTGSGATVATIGQMALNPLSGELYYAQAGVNSTTGNAVPADTGIYQVSINGGTPTLLTPSSNSLFNPNAIALDASANLLFFTDAYDANESGGLFPSVNELDVANLNTGSITVLMNFSAQSNSDPGFMLGGLAVDPVNNEIYMTATADFESNTSLSNAIYKIPFSVTGSGNSASASIGAVTTLYSGAGAFQPTDIAIDPAQGIFYAAGATIASGTIYGAIFEGNLSGGSSLTLVEPLSTIVAGSVAANDLIPQLDVLTAPTVTAGGTVTAVSGGSSVTADSSAAVTEQDGQLLTGATVSGILSGDTLSFNGGASKNFTDGFTISSSFSNGTLTLSGSASAADYQSALDAVAFSSTSSNATPRTLDWAVGDADFTSATSTSTVDVHVAPTVTAAGTVTFNGGGAAVALDPGLVVTDASSTTLAGATIAIAGFISADRLTFTNQNGISGTFNTTIGSLVLSGVASLAHYQTALESITYGVSPSNSDPTNGGGDTTRTIEWSVNDGVLNSGTVTSTLDTVHTAPTVTAGGTVTYQGEGFGSPVVLDSGIAVSDVDSGGVLSSATVTVSGAITGDTLNFTNINSTTEGNISVASDSGGVLKLTSSGDTATLQQWQTALASVTYSFSPSNGDPTKGGTDTSRTIDWTVSDGSSSHGTSGVVTSTLDVMPCYCRGTRILTDRGDVAVEALRIGDRVVTLSGAARPIRWIGYRDLDLTRHPAPEQAQPIRIRADAIADGVPRRDLRVSPDHAVLLDGMLVLARLLVNGVTIAREVQCHNVTYYHVELETHDIIMAEGMPAESYLDTGNRGAFSNAAEPLILHPNFADAQAERIQRSCRRFAGDADQVEPIWRRLADRARRFGFQIFDPVTTDDPRLRVMVDGRPRSPVSVTDGCYRFMLPRGTGEVRLVSRATAPCDLKPWFEDRRRLGVYVSRIVWHDRSGPHDVAVDHPSLGQGWWDVEGEGGSLRRWTNGDAVLRLPREAILLEVHVAEGMLWRADITLPANDETGISAASTAARLPRHITA